MQVTKSQREQSGTAETRRVHDGRMELRLPSAMLDDLRQLARRNDRPAAAEVRRALVAHLATQKEDRPASRPGDLTTSAEQGRYDPAYP